MDTIVRQPNVKSTPVEAKIRTSPDLTFNLSALVSGSDKDVATAATQLTKFATAIQPSVATVTNRFANEVHYTDQGVKHKVTEALFRVIEGKQPYGVQLEGSAQGVIKATSVVYQRDVAIRAVSDIISYGNRETSKDMLDEVKARWQSKELPAINAKTILKKALSSNIEVRNNIRPILDAVEKEMAQSHLRPAA
jgi:hypothetical protein